MGTRRVRVLSPRSPLQLPAEQGCESAVVLGGRQQLLLGDRLERRLSFQERRDTPEETRRIMGL